MIQAFKSGIADLVLGEDASAPERLYEKLFGLTSQRVAYEKGYMALYRLFGGYRDTVPYYVTCAYYRDGKTIPEIKDELQQLTSKGHRAFKAKVGGLPLKEDIARIEAIREVIGADDDLMIDVNRGWSLQTARSKARDCWSRSTFAGSRNPCGGTTIIGSFVFWRSRQRSRSRAARAN